MEKNQQLAMFLGAFAIVLALLLLGSDWFYPLLPYLCIVPIALFVASIALYNLDNYRKKLKKRACKRNGHVLKNHYVFENNETCTKTSVCERCEERFSEDMPHEIMDNSIYFLPSYVDKEEKPGVYDQSRYHKGEFENRKSTCLKLGVCKNCGKSIRISQQEHEETQYQEACEVLAKCSMCNNIRVLESHHQVGKMPSYHEVLERQYESLSDSYIVTTRYGYTCEVCGKEIYKVETVE